MSIAYAYFIQITKFCMYMEYFYVGSEMKQSGARGHPYGRATLARVSWPPLKDLTTLNPGESQESTFLSTSSPWMHVVFSLYGSYARYMDLRVQMSKKSYYQLTQLCENHQMIDGPSSSIEEAGVPIGQCLSMVAQPPRILHGLPLVNMQTKNFGFDYTAVWSKGGGGNQLDPWAHNHLYK